MRIRRCAVVMIELRERVAFDLTTLPEGGNGLRRLRELVALVPHLDAEIVVDVAEVAALVALSPAEWVDRGDAEAAHTVGAIASLIEKGLAPAEHSAAAARDTLFREQHWRPASAAMHYASRWSGVDTEAARRELAETLEQSLLEQLGPAPPAVRERVEASQRIGLPAPTPTRLDALLDARVTCRNWNTERALAKDAFAAVLYRTFGSRAVDDYAPGVRLLKKGVPSAGGLHPTEAYLLVQRVEGVAPGLYHYHAIDHALEPIRALAAAEARDLARTFVGAQPYFVDAHVLVIPASRFGRNFWKYRNHTKAYRALVLDVGHLSQTLYLAATELGLAAFITAAINEIDIEKAFGLDPLEEGPLAVCGFGVRGAERTEVEFDPLHAVWPATG
jgi:putative peptide maturation dehydrogenase